MNRSRRLSVVAALTVGVAVLLGPAAGIVSAHGGPGTIEVQDAAVTGTTVNVRVKVTFERDGHASDEATVTVAGSSGGNELTPVTLDPEGGETGIYTGVVQLPSPGDWSLRITSIEPPATATVPVTAAAAAPTAAPGAAPAGDPSSTTTTDPSSAGDAAGGAGDGKVISAAPASADGSGDSDGSPWMWVLGGIAAVAAVAVGVVFVARGRRSGIE